MCFPIDICSIITAKQNTLNTVYTSYTTFFDVLLTVHLSTFISVINEPVHETATYRCDDTRSCVMQF